MKQTELVELHELILQWFKDKNKSPNDVIAFLTATWVGQMCLNGYSEEFVDETLVYMKESWKNHPLNGEPEGFPC